MYGCGLSYVPLLWPSNSDLEAFVERASGSFIFAFTLINFVNDGGDLPHCKLLVALNAHAGLDPLYTQVLSSTHCNHNFECIIGTIMLLTSPLSITSLGHLLQLENVDILQCLLGIQSIIRIPGDDEHPVQLFHTSLHDFLTAKPCWGIFYIDPPTRHICIMINCLEVMAIPLGNSIFFHDEGQEYASGNWCHHFHQALIEGDSLIASLIDHSLMTSLTKFVSQSLDFWVNTLILHNNEQWKILLSVQERLEVRVIWFSTEKGVDHLPAITELSTESVTILWTYQTVCWGMTLPQIMKTTLSLISFVE
jgi:hypothetical protein